MEHHEHKKAFQIERLILFSDAVFAIAITLLVIELHLPDLSENSNHGLLEAMVHTIPHFISFVISFMIIGIYWIAHHRMFYYLTDYDSRTLWLNLLLLFFIAMMPFSSNIYGIHFDLDAAYFLYFLNISMISYFFYRMYVHISKPEKKLSKGLENPRLVSYYKWRSLVVPICFGIGVGLSVLLTSPGLKMMSRMAPMLIFIGMRIIRKRYADVVNIS